MYSSWILVKKVKGKTLKSNENYDLFMLKLPFQFQLVSNMSYSQDHSYDWEAAPLLKNRLKWFKTVIFTRPKRQFPVQKMGGGLLDKVSGWPAARWGLGYSMGYVLFNTFICSFIFETLQIGLNQRFKINCSAVLTT